MAADMRAAVARLREGGFTCVLRCGDTEYTATARGVAPLLELWDNGTDVRGFSAADKVVGQGAAFLYVLLGVRAVWADVMSESAREVLCRNGITVETETLVPYIINRRGDGQCPIETAVQGTRSPEEALLRIREALSQLNQKRN